MHTATRRFLFASLVVALIAGLMFTPGLPGDFVFDDIPNIVSNKSIQVERFDPAELLKAALTPQISGNMRGLPTLTFALDYWRGGGADPATFKTTNIVIHAITALILAWFFRSLLLTAGIAEPRARWLAPALALAWALHPLQVSSVLYVVQRLQTLGTLFLLLALFAYLKARQAQIAGQSGRTGLLAAVLLWVIAMGCKEDSVLLPAYALALELTVLRFCMADGRVSTALRTGYLTAVLAGAVLYVFWVLPQHWYGEAYPGRNFSTPERLLTQARVLCVYLWQIVLPLPQHMPFYYDGLQPSRGWLQPWTTLPATALIVTLLATAWMMRTRAPLFSLGVFIFFSAHFVASNVIGLELAFEHRNHFALIGAVLALGSLLAYVAQRLNLHTGLRAAGCALALTALGSATIVRAHSWNSALSLARTSTELAPNSSRAWISLCAGHFQAGGRAVANNPYLDEAIAACESGTISAPYAANSPALLIVLKTLRGDVTAKDWNIFQQRLATVDMTWDNQRSPRILMHHASNGVKLDKPQIIQAIATLSKRASLRPYETASLGYFILNDLSEPDEAMPYFVKAIESSPPGDPFPAQLGGELRAKGRPDLAEEIEKVGRAMMTR